MCPDRYKQPGSLQPDNGGLDPGMTDERMSIHTRLEKSSDGDLLREKSGTQPLRATCMLGE